MAPEFFFDMDDTLIYNQYMYTKAYANFIDFMLEKIKAKPSSRKQSTELIEIVRQTAPRCKGIEEIIEIYKLDRTIRDIYSTVHTFNVEGAKDNPENPYNKERVPNAFKKAYFAICNDKRFDCTAHDEEAQKAYHLGESFHNVKRDVIEGAEEVLEFLKAKGCRIRIYTCGDSWLQNKKIEVNGFDRYFDKNDQIIVPVKHNGEIKEYLGGCDLNQTFMVGNSIKSDIAPAIKLGLRAVYFPSATFYSWDEVEMPEEHRSKVLTIVDPKEIIKNYDLLASLK